MIAELGLEWRLRYDRPRKAVKIDVYGRRASPKQDPEQAMRNGTSFPSYSHRADAEE